MLLILSLSILFCLAGSGGQLQLAGQAPYTRADKVLPREYAFSL